MRLFKRSTAEAPPSNVETLPACSIRTGHVYVSSPSGGPAELDHGHWPTVIRTNYLENGEGGKPTIYLETSEAPGWVYCLDPDEPVTILKR